MQTVLVISVFGAMILAPCVIASLSRFFHLRLTIRLRQPERKRRSPNPESGSTATAEALHAR